MKVLSITEPYATLIKDKEKSIETRSWKTKYRGELYIHASKTKMTKEARNNPKIMGNIKGKELNYGKIICKCQLIDCVYMTKDFINEIKKNDKEYLYGIYEEGRYAWILEDVEELNTKIEAKGKLGIWNYDKENK